MKKIIAIFSVVLMSFVGIPRDGYSVDACRPQSCTGGDEMVNIMDGGANDAGLCWGCEEGDDDHECDGNAVVGQKDNDGFIRKVYICDHSSFIGISVGNSWNEITNSSWCSATDIRPSSFEDGGEYKCSYSLDGRTIDYSETVASLPLGGTPCKICKCRPGYIPNTGGADCILDPAAQNKCTESHGSWNSTERKCTCDSNKGLENTVPGTPGSPCRCKESGYVWDDSANDGAGGCIDPDAANKQKCKDSGGTWADDKCVCDSGKGLTGPNSDGVCYCKESGKIYDAGNDMCVASAKTWCEGTGGKWTPDASDPDEGVCDCDIPAKNIKAKPDSSPTRCECINEDYEYELNKPNPNGCKLKQSAQDRIDVFNKLKRICEKDWKSKWSPADATSEAARDIDNWECSCDGDGVVQTKDSKISCTCNDAAGYVLESATPPYRCRLSDYDADKQRCDASSDDVTWGDNGVAHGRRVGKCECNNKNKVYNYATNKCLDNETVVLWCKMIPGADIARDGSCLCRANSRPPVNNKCPRATAAGQQSPVPNVAAVNKAKDTIVKKIKELNEISDGFGRSHWKTASGNFNGARLASDSIAGVVLGTVGGVVTSNIIKKNQVKGGFENLNCTVGGQMVADYGDQFQVGIR